MSSTYREAVSRSTDAPLRQGDVIEAADEQASPWTRHLLVITADCDLANNKNSGRVTCVPLLSADDYLLQIYFPEQRRKVLDRFANEFNAELARLGKNSLSSSRILEWALEASAWSELEIALDIPSDSGQEAEKKFDGIRLLNEHSSTVNEALENIVEAQLLHTGPKKREAIMTATHDAIGNRFRNTPGDALFLRSIAPTYDLGYFAYLRHIEQIWEPKIAVSPMQTQVTHRRIGALADRFAHAVVQRFAMVFMPIGLPVDYEESRNAFSDELRRSLN